MTPRSEEPELAPAARAFADGDVDLLPTALSGAEIEGLVAALVVRGDVERLGRLAEAGDKRLGKPARRGLHLLKTRGARLVAPAPRAYRPPGPYAQEESLSLASLIDGRGERLVWYVRGALDGSGLEVFQAELSETHGLIGFQAGSATRREWRAHLQRVESDGRLGVSRVPTAHARRLIDEGYQRSLAIGRVPPAEYVRASLALGPVEPRQGHPARELAPPLERAQAVERLASLHTLAEIAPWLPPRAALDPLERELTEIAESRLVVDASQRRAQLSGAVERAADRALDPELRERLAARLEETALLLALRGREEEARLCTTAADLTRDQAVPGSANGFVLQLFHKLIDVDTILRGGEAP